MESDENKQLEMNGVDALQAEVIAVFEDAARMLGLPKSLGGIYGLLFISKEPLSLDDVVARLNVSKGSASQGLRFLRNLGAVRPVPRDGERREYFTAEVELKQLVAGFIKFELEPQIRSGLDKSRKADDRLKAMQDMGEIEGDLAEYLGERVYKLNQWHQRASWVLPFIARFLG